LRTLFEREFSAAVTEADAGRSVTPGTQLTRAARAAGRIARPEVYIDALERLVGGTPFRTAPEAIAVLGELRASGYAVGVISNTVGELGRFLRPILTRFGFDRYVEVYTFSDEHPWAKPAPEIFQSTLDALGSDPTVAVHVGDGWADIEGPRRAGMRGAILYTGLQEYGGRYRELNLPQGREVPPSDHRVSSLPDVVPIVHRMLRPARDD
jgi:HAD superfamily hydrolase (TIGR01549 family)